MNLNTNTPHIDRAWAEAFLLELRLRGASGPAIGAALAEIEAHCAESGETAQEAFGDPAAYAAALEVPDTRELNWRRELAPAALGLVGMFGVLQGIGAWGSADGVPVTTGLLGTFVVLVGGAVLIARFAAPLIRLIVRHRWLSMIVVMLLTPLFVVLLLLGRRELFSLPVAAALIAGALCLVASTFLYLRSDLGDPEADAVVGPLGAKGAGTMEVKGGGRTVSALTPWLFPLLTVLVSIPALLIR